MKNIYFLTLCMMIIGKASAQTESTLRGCLADKLSQKQYELHPERLVANEQLEAFTKEFVKRSNTQSAQRTGPYVVPVVFHILQDAGSENLTDSIIFAEMEHWNEYASMTNPELPTVVPSFDTLVGNPQVEFRLAQRDPQGNCTNGIERIYTYSTYNGDDNNKQDPWPPEKYLNVWVTNTMSAANNSAAAYAYYPGSVSVYVNNDIIDGIIVLHDYVGSSNAYNRPTLAHESGHWMNLAHTWGGTNDPGVDCSGDDFVDDTPPTKGDFGTCPLTESVCNRPVIENVQNIMNYSSCHFMYTKGQVARMHAALNSSVSSRSNIWSQANLVATGTDQPLSYPNPNSCAVPVADFAANYRYVCSGQPVKFTDVSWNANIDSRLWTFPANASLVGSSDVTDKAPVVTFTTSGWQEVTLAVTNANGTNQKVKSMVYVSDGTVITAPYFEGFEDATATQNNWQSVNYDNNNTYFRRNTQAGHYSSACFMLNEYNALLDGDKDELVSPTFDLTSIDPTQMTLSFDYSYATFNANHMNDSIASLAVFATKDCGVTWARIYFNAGGFNLFNAGAFSTGPYTPGQQDEYWKNVTINLPPGYDQSNVNFKFTLLSARATNQFYIDNINIGQSTTGISHVKSNISSITIEPNPTQGTATLSLMNSYNTNATVKMMDMTGREVMTLFSGQLPAGEKNISFDTQNISSGIYMMSVNDGKTTVQKRFVKM